MNGYDFYSRIWLPAAQAVSSMEEHGLHLDTAECDRAAAECLEKRAAIADQLNEWAGCELNWASTKQKAAYLYDVRGWPVPPICGSVKGVKQTRRDKRPVDEVALHWLAENVPDDADRAALRLLVGWRDVKEREHESSFRGEHNLVGFFRGLPEHARLDGRVHPSLAATTKTGRLASTNPNLQNQPPIVRRVFIAPEGHLLIAADFSGLEWRILGHIIARRYKDFSIVEETRAGIDPHQATADSMTQAVGWEVSRAYGKILNYAINYGKTEKGLAIQLGVSEAQAVQLLEAFFAARPGVARWLTDCVEYARQRGYCRTLLGRYRYLDYSGASRWQQYALDRQAKNSPIQGSAADIVSVAMIRCSEHNNDVLRSLQVRQILQIHDELLFECPADRVDDAAEEIQKQMAHCLEGVCEFLCPLETSKGVGVNWAECK